MEYAHRLVGNCLVNLPVGKVVCVGRNYAEHAKELNNPIPDQPLLFIKPSTTLVALEKPFTLPRGRGSVHYELEIAVLIGQQLTCVSPQAAEAAIAGVGLGLDLTLRDLQSELKAKGHPWERAKSFDGACPVSAFVPPEQIADLHNLTLSFWLNGQLRQQGSSAQMLTPMLDLISHISHQFTLLPGDIVLTGTPAGVGEINPGDTLRAQLEDKLSCSTQI